jgi:hypothetical protein
MATSEEEYPLELWEKNLCPWCEKSIPEGSRVGSGRKGDGGFCSLSCFTHYYEMELVARAKRIAEMAERHRTS